MKIPMYWRLQSQRYKLQGVTCPNCSRKIFPPRDVCPYCETSDTAPKSMEGAGLFPTVQTNEGKNGQNGFGPNELAKEGFSVVSGERAR